MQTSNKLKSVWKKLRFSYKLTIFNEHTLEQVVMLRISRLTVILSIFVAVVLIGGLTTYLITRTPLRRTLPGYISPEMRRQIVDNALAVDSLSGHGKHTEGLSGQSLQHLLGQYPSRLHRHQQQAGSSHLLHRFTTAGIEHDQLVHAQICRRGKIHP